MVPRFKLFHSIPLHVQKLNCEKNVYKLRDHVGEKALNSNLPLELKLAKKTPIVSFPNHLLKNVWVESTFPYAMLPCHEGAKRDTIGVIRGQVPNYHIIKVLD